MAHDGQVIDSGKGVSESLARELTPFNIRVLAIEPGSFRTNFFSPTAMSTPPERVSAPYRDTPADQALSALQRADGMQPGDPSKAAEAMLDVILLQGKGSEWDGRLRCILGDDALARAKGKLDRFEKDVNASQVVGSNLGLG